jgi:hypothetical protein
MTSQRDPDRSNRPLHFLKHENGNWNLLVIFGAALGVVFVAYMLLDSTGSVPV